MCSAMRSSAITPATARTSSRTCCGWPTPIVSPSEISSAPSASSWRTTSTTRRRRDVAFVRAAAHRRDVGAQQHAVGARALGDRAEALEVLGDAAVHVLAVVGLARRHEERGDRQRGGAQPLVARFVRHQRAVGRARRSRDDAAQLVGVGELRDPLRRHERRDLDAREAARRRAAAPAPPSRRSGPCRARSGGRRAGPTS